MTLSHDSDKGSPTPKRRAGHGLEDHERWAAVLAAFADYKPVKSGPGQYALHCPCHEDRTRSASLALATDGKVLFYCHAAGCCATCQEAFGRVGLDLNLAFRDSDGWTGGRRANTKGAAYVPPRSSPPAKPPPDWQAIHAEALVQSHTPEAQRTFALDLGVSRASAAALEVTWRPERDAIVWTWPERDGTVRIVGMNRRWPDGSKKAVAGSKRGLCYALDWSRRPGAALIPEGASDTAAGLTMGLPTIGRPNAYQASTPPQLAELLANHPDREVLLVADNDANQAGRQGAERTASALAALLGRPVAWAPPPGGMKDLRAWWSAQGIDPEDRETAAEAGQRLLAEVLPGRVIVYPSGWQSAQTLFSLGEEGRPPLIESLCAPGSADSASTSQTGSYSSSTTTRLEDVRVWLGLPFPPPQSACPRLQRRLSQHRQNRSQFNALFLCCKSWVCEVCYRRRAFAWAVSLADRIASWPVADDLTPSFFILHLGAPEWKRLRPKVSRAKQQYVYIASVGFLLTTFAAPQAEAVSAAVAIRRLGEAIRIIPPPPPDSCHYQPISSSRGWKLPSTKRPSGGGERTWDLFGELEVWEPAPLVALLKQRGITPAVETTSKRDEKQAWAVRWTCPLNWTPEQCQALGIEVLRLRDME